MSQHNNRTFAEILISCIIDEAGKSETLDAAIVLSELQEKLGHDPTYQEVADHIGLDPRADKQWPPEEDCHGCDARLTGPHRFSCSVAGKQQLAFHATESNGIMIITDPLIKEK